MNTINAGLPQALESIPFPLQVSSPVPLSADVRARTKGVRSGPGDYLELRGVDPLCRFWAGLNQGRTREAGVEVWIQQYDCSLKAVSEPSVEKCLELLRSHDWESELSSYEQALEGGRDRCPPGLQLIDGDRVLQIMPVRAGRAHYSYSCDHPLRLLAFLGASKTLNAWDVGPEYQVALVQNHFEGDQRKLVRMLVELTSSDS